MKHRKEYTTILLTVIIGIFFQACSGLDNSLNPEQSLKVGIDKLEANQFSQADFYFVKVTKDEDFRSEGFHYLAKSKIKQKKYHDAIQLIENYISDDGGFDAKARLNVAQAYYFTNNYDRALAHLKVAQKLKPKDEKVLVLQATVLMAQNRYEEASRILKTAKNINDKNLDIFYKLAQIEFQLGDYNKASFYAYKCVSGNNTVKANAYGLLAKISMKVRDYKGAYKMAVLAYEQTNNTDLLVIQAESLSKMGRNNEAREIFKQLSQAFPENLDYSYQLALYHIDHQEFLEAKTVLKKIIAKNSDYDKAHEQMINIFNQIDDINGAGKYLKNLYTKSPDKSWVALAYAKILDQAGETEMAIKVAQNEFSRTASNESKMMLKKLDSNWKVNGQTDSVQTQKRSVANEDGIIAVVGTGDTLGSISQKYLGTTKRWPEILEYNRTTIKTPSDLTVGMKLRIPNQ